MSEQAPARPIVAQKAPYGVDVEAGKSYWWCVCGRSAKQPFCDGSHKGSGLAPMKYDADKTAKVWFCGCKATKKAPLCDGTHKSI
jgi:CDGSH-type Zn-finger protein